MRRLMPIAAFALFLSVPLWAQHGGGHAGGGHGGGFSGGHGGFSGGSHGGGFSGGHVGGGHVSGGMHVGSGSRGFSRPSFSQRGFSQRSFSGRPFLHDGFRNRFRGDRFRAFGFRNNCFGYVCRGYGYPWYGGYYDPYWWDSSSRYDDDYNQNLAVAAEMNRENLEEQRMMRQEETDGDQDIYAGSAPAPRVASSEGPKGASFMPDIVLVYRDQHKEEVTNYAIVGHTLWNFSPGHTGKVSLSDLDLAATERANDANGVTFRLPTQGEAQ